MTTPADRREWLTLPELVTYSRLGLRTLNRAIYRDENPLPSHLVMGRRLVVRHEYDAWALGRSVRLTKRMARTLKRLGLEAT